MKHSKRYFLIIAGAIAMSWVLFLLGSSECAEQFPDRPITLIVNYGAGGSTDIAARLFAMAAEKKLGVPIIVVNKPGAGATLGVTELSRAKPDGYTIGTLPDSPIVIIPLMQKLAYDPFKSFDFICGYGSYTYGICVKADSRFKTIKDVVEWARKNPGKVTYASYSPGISVAFKYLEIKENIKFTGIPVQSGQEAVTNVLGGHIDMGTGGEFLPFLESKEVRYLAAVSGERLRFIPDVPTMKELGYDIDITGWMSLGAPAGVPKDRLDIIHNAFNVASTDSHVKATMDKLMLTAPFIAGEEVRKIFLKRVDAMKPLIDALMAEPKK